MSWEQQKSKRGKNVSALSFQKESKLTTPFWKGNRLLLRNVQIKHMLSGLHSFYINLGEFYTHSSYRSSYRPPLKTETENSN